MNSNTPALEISPKDLERNTEALKVLLAHIPPNAVSRILDVRFGLGGWVKEALRVFPNARVVGYEQDLETAKASWHDSRINLKVRKFKGDKSKYQLVLADFNTVTQLRRVELDELLSCQNPPYILFTDVCCSKLHLNWKFYGLKQNSLEDYWRSFNVGGYKLVAYAKVHYAASSALFRQNTKKKPPNKSRVGKG